MLSRPLQESSLDLRGANAWRDHPDDLSSNMVLDFEQVSYLRIEILSPDDGSVVCGGKFGIHPQEPRAASHAARQNITNA